MFEKPTDLFAVTFANHAHNDLLELAMETGAPGLALLGFFLFWLVSRLRASWTDRSRFAHPDTPLIDAAGLIVVLLLIHELVDYPLRTSALACVFAFACALLIEPPMSSGERDALPASPPVPAGRTR
jgi:O-antigen ligase